MKVAVVILNYNGESLLRQLLPQVVAQSPEAEVVVTDNASTDGSAALLKNTFPHVRTLELDKNYGFAEGYNRALAQLDAELFVLLNSDVEVSNNWLLPIVELFENQADVAACQPKLLNYNSRSHFEYAGACGGYIDALGYPFCRGRIFGTVEEDAGQYDSQTDIFWATGACLCIRADKFREVGGFDKRFFAHMEEIDLCWRLRARGNRIVCIPQSVVYHIGAQTLAYEHPHKTYLNFRNNLLMIYKNAPNATRILTARFLLDFVAAMQFLLQGKPKNGAAVLRAQRDFLRTKRNFTAERTENLRLTVENRPKGQINRPILWDYYVLRRRLARNLIGFL